MTTPTRPLDAHSASLLLQTAALAQGLSAEQLTPDKRRTLMCEATPMLLDANAPSLGSESLHIPLPGRSLPARLYQAAADAPHADVLCVFFHGGGWVAGDLHTHDHACQFLAQHLGCTLLSVEYRKSPEHRFPAPCDDAADALAWAHAQCAQWGCTRVLLCGDSAGGHLAAHAMHAQPAVPVAAALLIYPVADMQFDNTSYTERGSGPGLMKAGMLWFWEQFLGSDTPVDDPRAVLMRQVWASPPPPTVVAVAWHDPLHDEGVAYAALLEKSGGQVVLQTAPDMAHGYLRQCWVNDSARAHLLAAIASVRVMLGR
jgi:acetyl esterase